MEATFFKTARDFERWLAANHRKATALLVGFHKVGSVKGSITYREVLDAALIHEWIDGVRQRLEEDAYTIRFTPRKQGQLLERDEYEAISAPAQSATLMLVGVRSPSGKRVHALPL